MSEETAQSDKVTNPKIAIVQAISDSVKTLSDTVGGIIIGGQEKKQERFNIRYGSSDSARSAHAQRMSAFYESRKKPTELKVPIIMGVVLIVVIAAIAMKDK